MNHRQHWAVFINNSSNKTDLIHNLLSCVLPIKGVLFSQLELTRFMEEEERHGTNIITKDAPQSLISMSSGEQKKALLKHLLTMNPHFMILDNPFDNLDTESKEQLTIQLNQIALHTQLIQIVSRKNDVLPFMTEFFFLNQNKLQRFKDLPTLEHTLFPSSGPKFRKDIPPPLIPDEFDREILVQLKNVSVSYNDRIILKDIDWTIKTGSFWQLAGENGSGKTTLLSMITGENSKGYGQELYIFGQKKGSGESIWDIKKRIGYFTPSMTDKFSGHHTSINMLISGFKDSIGLYQKPTDLQIALATEWLELIEMQDLKNVYFHDLSMGQQRLLMIARAMIKHPLLLILDEPTAGLDDESAALFVALTNKMAQESKTAIIFVSHRKEPGLQPDYIYRLERTNQGSIGRILEPGHSL